MRTVIASLAPAAQAAEHTLLLYGDSLLAGYGLPPEEGFAAQLQAALDAAGKTYEAHIYEGANHGFHNDSTPRYDEAAAELAWSRTIDWFRQHLG